MHTYRITLAIVAGCLLASNSAFAAKAKDRNPPPAGLTTAPVAFAPVATNHPLAGIWNDPEFVRQLLGSYGFHSEVEPRLNAEEQQFYREKIVPLLREDPAKAIPELQSRIKPDGSALFDYLLGNIYFQNQEFAKATELFEQATLKFPNFLRAWKNLGFALVRDGKYAEAINPLARTMSLGGGDGKSFGLLGFSCMNTAKYASAEAAYKQAMLFEPDNTDFKLGLVKSQVALANYDGALAMLDEMLQQHPESETLWSIQANVLLQKQLPAKAAVNFEVLRRMDKASAQDLTTLGDIYVSQDAKELALEAYLEAVEKDSWEHPSRALRAADILVSRGAWEEANVLFAKIRETAGTKLADQEELKLLKMQSKVAMANGQGEEAVKVLEQIIERNSLDGEALLLTADYYARHGQPEKAESRYKTAANIDGFEADAYVKHAQLLVQTQKYAQAAELLQKAQRARYRENVQRYLEKIEQLALTAHS